MATAIQPQQVVVVQQVSPQQMVQMQQISQPQTVSAGEGNATTRPQSVQPQTVIVVQQQQPPSAQEANRQPRWSYLIFTIGYFAYHFIWSWAFFVFLYVLPAMVFFGGLVPAFIAWIWIIVDSTVYCANPGTGPIKKMCCCECTSVYTMSIPMALAAILRFILWCVIVGEFFDVFLAAEGESDIAVFHDNFFFFFLSVASFDVGPMIYVAVDWWYYYGKQDYNGILGVFGNPLRCALAQSIVIAFISWSFVGVFVEFEETHSFIWPWILHGILAIAVIIFAVILNFSDGIKGNAVKSAMYKYIGIGLGVALGILVAIIYFGYIIRWTFGGYYWFLGLILFVYGLYYLSLTVPTIWALCSLKVQDPNVVDSAV